MSRLFRAYLYQLKKSRMFWGLFIFYLLCAIIVPVIAHCEMLNYQVSYKVEDRLWWHTLLIGFTAAFFTASFIGTEHSDGTIRNKIIMGYSRTDIYLTSLGICTFAVTIMSLVHEIIISILGVWLISPFKNGFSSTLVFYVISLLLGVVFTSIYTTITILLQNKAASVICCMLICLILFGTSLYIAGALNEPQMMLAPVTVTVDGMESTDMTANPQYVDGALRSVYEFLAKALPFGQVIRLTNHETDHLTLMAACDVVISVLSVLIGMLCFCKKDMK